MGIADLRREALRAGMHEEEFWRATPKAAVDFIEAWAFRRHLDMQAALTQAWHTARLHRVSRMPSLAETIPGDFDAMHGDDGEITPMQVWNRWEAWALQANAIHAAHQAQINADAAAHAAPAPVPQT